MTHASGILRTRMDRFILTFAAKLSLAHLLQFASASTFGVSTRTSPRDFKGRATEHQGWRNRTSLVDETCLIVLTARSRENERLQDEIRNMKGNMHEMHQCLQHIVQALYHEHFDDSREVEDTHSRIVSHWKAFFESEPSANDSGSSLESDLSQPAA